MRHLKDPVLDGMLSSYESGDNVVLASTICPKAPENSVRYHAGLSGELDVMFPGLEESLVSGRIVRSGILYYEARSSVYPQIRAVQVSTTLPMTPQVEFMRSAEERLKLMLGEGKPLHFFLPENLTSGLILKCFLRYVTVDDDRLTLWSAQY